MATQTDLGRFISSTPISDTHEHLQKEAALTQSPPDILVDIFENYVTADLVVAGATQKAVDRLVDPKDADIAARFSGISEAWERCRHTGYGEAVREIARRFYGLNEITASALEGAQWQASRLRQPGARLQALRDAGIDHVQIDDFCWQCLPDESGSDFFLYDLSWLSFCNGQVDAGAILTETGVEVQDVESLRNAMAALFKKYGPCAIAVKSQHAYNRTLKWEERSEADAAEVLKRELAGEEVDDGSRCLLGDWCTARGVELATEHNLPFKIHTGYYAGHSRMPVDRIASGNLCALLARYPQARFVLMHIAYPYSEELIAIAKHYPNVWIDLCWAWSINPYAATDFVRSYIHAVPANKLLGFGGDSFWPWASVAYSLQARAGLARALQAEVSDGLLTEREAIALAERFMQGNQKDCFDLEGRRQTIADMLNA